MGEQYQQLPGILSYGVPFTNLYRCDDVDDELLKPRGQSFMALVDSGFANSTPGKAYIARLDEVGAGNIRIETGGESSKSFSNAVALDALGARFDSLLLIGGGALINLGTYYSATRPFPHHLSIVPTTTMAIADVAVGGLGLLNDDAGRKNAIRAVRDPNKIVLCDRFFEDTPLEVRSEGLVEVAKHAVVQCPSSASRFLNGFADNVTPANALDIALTGIELKGATLRLTASMNADDIEFFLSYGHLHAHAIEEIHKGSVSHGTCVAVGICIDLLLAEDLLYNQFIQTLRDSAILGRLVSLLTEDLCDQYIANYPRSGRFFAGDGKYLVLDCSIARTEWERSKSLVIERKTVSIHQISEAFASLRADLSE